MSDDAVALRQQIAALEQVITLLPDKAASLQPELNALQSRLNGMSFGQNATVSNANLAVGNSGNLTQNSGTVYGSQVGINLGTLIFGRTPAEEDRRRLVRYLDRLVYVYGRLSLRGLVDPNKGFDSISLDQIFITLGTDYEVELLRGSKSIIEQITEKTTGQFRLKKRHDPKWALPDQAVVSIQSPSGDHGLRGNEGGFFSKFLKRTVFRAPVSEWVVWRSELALDALESEPHVIIVGDPGSGKSVLLRRYVSMLALKALNNETSRLPLFVTARKLAERLVGVPQAEWPTVAVDFLASEAQRMLACDPISDLVKEALHTRNAMVLIDGLDEVPRKGTDHTISREAVLDVLRVLSNRYPKIGVALTCRTRAFDDALLSRIRWPVRTLTPFTLGQIRAFLHAWYDELRKEGFLTSERMFELQKELMDAIHRQKRLRAMATSPLLLTLMAQLLYADGSLPRDRPALYERMMELLLGHWDSVREEGKGAENKNIGNALGLPDWRSKDILPFLDKVSYVAHLNAASEDGRGRLPKAYLTHDLIKFFEDEGVPDAWQVAGRCLEYIEQRSGLLAPDGPDDYVFAHLTFQEHCAGRYLVTDPFNAAAVVLCHRHDDRWREPIMLGLGVIQDKNIYLVNTIIQGLIRTKEGDPLQPKDLTMWHNDLLLAADIGADRGWDRLRRLRLDVAPLQDDLRMGLIDILEHPRLERPERIRAAEHLAVLGDPRFPVDTHEWRETLGNLLQIFTDQSTHYWRFIPGGSYWIGGWDKDETLMRMNVSPFWVARFPITVAQFAPFVSEGYVKGAQLWWVPQGWTAQGWRWRIQSQRNEPWGWNRAPVNVPNQPVIGLTWYEAQAFCQWLTAELRDTLPAGMVIRLPTEAEWEIMAAWDGSTRRVYPWLDAERTPDHAVYIDESGAKGDHPMALGVCMKGMAACGAVDVVGNVWEWTASHWDSYPSHSTDVVCDTDQVISVRGGSFWSEREDVTCAGRKDMRPTAESLDVGFRVVIGKPMV